jgi:hypothetical protein
MRRIDERGGFSYRAKREINFPLEIWQASFVNHRIRDAEDYKHHHTYIWENPVRAGLRERPELFAWSSASLRVELDAPPPGLENPLPELKSGAGTDQAAACYKYGDENVETPGPALAVPQECNQLAGFSPCWLSFFQISEAVGKLFG